MRTIGIDVGLNGAIAVIDNNFVGVYDIATIKVKDKTKIDASKVADLLRTLANGSSDVMVVIEAVHAMPRQGVVSMFGFGVSYGIIQGICAALNLSVRMVTPQSWKSSYVNFIGHEDAKNRARELAIEYFPSLAQHLERKRDHNRADALLIAKYGQTIKYVNLNCV